LVAKSQSDFFGSVQAGLKAQRWHQSKFLITYQAGIGFGFRRASRLVPDMLGFLGLYLIRSA